MHRLLFVALICGSPSVSAQLPGFDAFYTMDNDAGGNHVLVGMRSFDRFFVAGSFATGGLGTSAGLGSQGALCKSGDGRYLLVVNPGSDSVSLMRNFGVSLGLCDVVPSGGARPTSVDVHRDLVYVLNADSDQVSGFRIAGAKLRPLGSFALSGSGVAAAQVGFSADGSQLIVAERATNLIDVFPVLSDGRLGTLRSTRSVAPTPFGFVVRRDGTLIISEAAGGQAGLGAVSSYKVQADGRLVVITGGLATQQTASCWVAFPRSGRLAYATNTGSGTVTGMRVDAHGALSLLDARGVSGTIGATARPIDFAFGNAGRTMFVLDSGNDVIRGLYRHPDGSLHLLAGSLSVPDGAAGLQVR